MRLAKSPLPRILLANRNRLRSHRPMRIRYLWGTCWTIAWMAASPSVSCGAVGTAANQLTDEEKAAGWGLLFDGKTTRSWRSFKKASFPAQGWIAEDGWLHCPGKTGGDIITDAEFDDFELQWEWKQAPSGNSGVKYFITETRQSAIGHEYPMIDEENEPDARQADGKRVTASFYDVLKPTRVATKPAGAINQSRIVVRGNHVEHWLNGEKVLEYECGSEAVKAAVAQSKFKDTADFGNKIKGHILLQDHHSEVWFRNLKIRSLANDGHERAQKGAKS